MGTLNQQLLKARSLDPQRISNELFRFVRSIEEKIINLNRDQLKNESEDVFGDPIGFYSYATELITHGSKKAGEPFDAEDTGDFLKSFYISVKGDNVSFGAKDPKTEIILDSDNWLSHDLFGLTDENLRELIQSDMLPFVIKYGRNMLGIQ